jgi:hypothetical protein
MVGLYTHLYLDDSSFNDVIVLLIEWVFATFGVIRMHTQDILLEVLHNSVKQFSDSVSGGCDREDSEVLGLEWNNHSTQFDITLNSSITKKTL